MSDKQVHPASIRNAAPILAELRKIMPVDGLVLEIASGSGYHAVTFARALPHVTWQPSDADPSMLPTIEAHIAEAGLANIKPPVALDVTRAPWPVDRATAVICINMIHISPWAATEALFAEAGRILPMDGVLFTYGPYSIDGDYRGDGNVAFDQSLKARNPAWGIRDLRDIAPLAETHGFNMDAPTPMPANNLTLIFRKRPSAPI